MILYSEKKDCCGCGACSNICPKKAITMIPDECGFLYPQIDNELCVDCGMCKKICVFQNKGSEKKPIKVYGAARKSQKIQESTSGGIFSVLAEQILESGGVVFGSAMVLENDKLVVKHISIESQKDLIKLKGSKYVQSFSNDLFLKVKYFLENGKKVLLSGTPCQIAAMRSFLKKEYEGLYLIDIICHGVPSNKFFQDYIKQLEKKKKVHIKEFKFRDKRAGWGLNASILFEKDGKEFIEYMEHNTSSYYTMFLSSEIYRLNCYSCKYACQSRSGDITLGDFWGIEEEHPEVLQQNGGFLEEKKGISVVMINSEKGIKIWDSCVEKVQQFESSYEKAANYNHQLYRPSYKGKHREKILELYVKDGYEAVERFYSSILIKKRITNKIKGSIPKIVKKRLRLLLKKMGEFKREE